MFVPKTLPMDLFVIPLLLMLMDGGTAYDVEDVALYLPLVRAVASVPRPCPPNELWQPCTANCSDCERRGSCPLDDCLSGCDCVPGYFRRETGGACLPVAKCPRPECGANEVFRECGPVCERCATLRCRLMSCDHRCYCKEGHLRDEQGACVPEDHCPHRERCGHGEEWAESGPSDEYCLGGGEEANGTLREVPGCYCKDGRRRNTFGSCVPSCTYVRCYGRAVYRKCVPRCNVTCHSDPSCEEEGGCFPGCFCAPGHVMNDFNNCVPTEECPPEDAVLEVKIVRGPGILLEESGDDLESTTPESTTHGLPETTPGLPETTPGSPDTTPGSPETTTEADERQTDSRTEATTEDEANEDV